MAVVPPSFEDITARLDELQATCARLSEENAELRSRLTPAPAAPHQTGHAETAEDPVEPRPGMSRRGIIRTALKATAAAAIGTALVERGVLPAAAANGDAVTAGNVTLAEGSTTVKFDGASNFSGVVLLGSTSGLNGSGGALYPAAAGGWAGTAGVANGVYGFTDQGAGNGVVGYNSNAVSGGGNGVLGAASGTGSGVLGTNSSTAGSVTAVKGIITATSAGGFSSAVRGQNDSTGGGGIGVWGSQNGSGWGMFATSASGIGITASGGTGTGVNTSGNTGVNAFGAVTGVLASGETAVSGTSSSTASSATAIVGVISSTSPGGFSSAIRGQNNGTGGLGIGVWGSHAGSGWGMYATSASGVGINATGGSGIGVSASGAVGLQANGSTAAISVNGRAVFSRSGTISIPAGSKVATVSGVTLAATSLVLATAQNSTGVWVASAVPNIPGSNFKITLNKPVPATKTAVIAWFVVN